jgi:hypothetical protein
MNRDHIAGFLSKSLSFSIFFTLFSFISLVGAETDVKELASSASNKDDTELDLMIDDLLGPDPRQIELESIGLQPKDPGKSVSHFLDVAAKLGYRNNLLSSSLLIEEDSFVKTSLDFYLTTANPSKNEVVFYLFAEQSHFLTVQTDGDEQYLTTRLQLKRKPNSVFHYGIRTDYVQQTYLDSTTAVVNQSIPVLHNTDGSVTPFAQIWIGSTMSASLEITASENTMSETDEDYRGSRISAGYTYYYGSQSQLKAAIEVMSNSYDNFKTRNLEGQPVYGTVLQTQISQVKLQQNHHSVRFSSFIFATEILGTQKTDNGAGYYNYFGQQAAETVKYTSGKWEAHLAARLSHYAYEKRLVTGTAEETLDIVRQSLTGSATGKISTTFLVNVEFRYTNSIANDEVETFASSSLIIGVTARF